MHIGLVPLPILPIAFPHPLLVEMLKLVPALSIPDEDFKKDTTEGPDVVGTRGGCTVSTFRGIVGRHGLRVVQWTAVLLIGVVLLRVGATPVGDLERVISIFSLLVSHDQDIAGLYVVMVDAEIRNPSMDGCDGISKSFELLEKPILRQVLHLIPGCDMKVRKSSFASSAIR